MSPSQLALYSPAAHLQYLLAGGPGQVRLDLIPGSSPSTVWWLGALCCLPGPFQQTASNHGAIVWVGSQPPVLQLHAGQQQRCGHSLGSAPPPSDGWGPHLGPPGLSTLAQVHLDLNSGSQQPPFPSWGRGVTSSSLSAAPTPSINISKSTGRSQSPGSVCPCSWFSSHPSSHPFFLSRAATPSIFQFSHPLVVLSSSSHNHSNFHITLILAITTTSSSPSSISTSNKGSSGLLWTASPGSPVSRWRQLILIKVARPQVCMKTSKSEFMCDIECITDLGVNVSIKYTNYIFVLAFLTSI